MLKLWKISKKKKTNEVVYYGTYLEFVDKLKKLGYFETEQAYEDYLELETVKAMGNSFGRYVYEPDYRRVCIGEARAYSVDNSPTYPDKTVVELRTEGYSLDEINQAVRKALEELKKQREEGTEGIKDFLIKKL